MNLTGKVRREPRPGKPYPRGATWDGEGVSFALFSGTPRKSSCVYSMRRDRRELGRIELRDQTGSRVATSLRSPRFFHKLSTRLAPVVEKVGLGMAFTDQAFNRTDHQIRLLQGNIMAASLCNDEAMVFEARSEILLQREPLVFELLAQCPSR